MQDELEELASYVRHEPGAATRQSDATDGAALVRVAERRLQKPDIC